MPSPALRKIIADIATERTMRMPIHRTIRSISPDMRLVQSTYRSYGLRDAATYTGKSYSSAVHHKHPGHPFNRKTGVVRAKGYHCYKELFGSMFSDYQLYANTELATLALPEDMVRRIYTEGHNQGSATVWGVPSRAKLGTAWAANRSHVQTLYDKKVNAQGYAARKEITFRLDIIAVLYSQGGFSTRSSAHNDGAAGSGQAETALGGRINQRAHVTAEGDNGSQPQHHPYWVIPTRGINAFVFTNASRFISTLDNIFQLGALPSPEASDVGHYIARYYTALLFMRLLQLGLTSETDLFYDHWIWRAAWEAPVYGDERRARIGTVTRRGLGLLARLHRDSWVWLDDQQMDWMHKHLTFKVLTTCFIPRNPKINQWLSQTNIQGFTTGSVRSGYLVQHLVQTAAIAREEFGELGSSATPNRARRRRLWKTAVSLENRAIGLIINEVARAYSLHLLEKLQRYWEAMFKSFKDEIPPETSRERAEVMMPALFCESVDPGMPAEDMSFLEYARIGPPTLTLLLKKFRNGATPMVLLPVDLAAVYHEACSIYFEQESAMVFASHDSVVESISAGPGREPRESTQRTAPATRAQSREAEIGLQGLFPRWLPKRGKDTLGPSSATRDTANQWSLLVYRTLFDDLKFKTWRRNAFCELYETLRDTYNRHRGERSIEFENTFRETIGNHILVMFNSDNSKEVGTLRAMPSPPTYNNPCTLPRAASHIANTKVPSFFLIQFQAPLVYAPGGIHNASLREQMQLCFKNYDHFLTLRRIQQWRQVILMKPWEWDWSDGFVNLPEISEALINHLKRVFQMLSDVQHLDGVDLEFLDPDRQTFVPRGLASRLDTSSGKHWGSGNVGHFNTMVEVQGQTVLRISDVKNSWPAMFLPFKELVTTIREHVADVVDCLSHREFQQALQSFSANMEDLSWANDVCDNLGINDAPEAREDADYTPPLFDPAWYRSGQLSAADLEQGAYQQERMNSHGEYEDMMNFLNQRTPPQEEAREDQEDLNGHEDGDHASETEIPDSDDGSWDF